MSASDPTNSSVSSSVESLPKSEPDEQSVNEKLIVPNTPQSDHRAKSETICKKRTTITIKERWSIGCE